MTTVPANVHAPRRVILPRQPPPTSEYDLNVVIAIIAIAAASDRDETRSPPLGAEY
jgi:hypothetical protein